MTDIEKYKLISKTTKYIVWALEVAFVAAFVALAAAASSQRHTISKQKNIIDRYEQTYRPAWQEQKD